MKQISQAEAHRIAGIMSKPLREKRNAAEETFKALLYDMYRETIPADVLALFAKHPRYFNTCSTVSVHGNGFNGERFSIAKGLPHFDGSWNMVLQPDKKQAAELQKKYRLWQDLDKKHEGLRKNIQQALLTLKTRKNIEENLPEAVPHLPASTSSTALIPNLKGLRKEISELGD